ncbi:hypothetical protein GMA10_08905 [Kocuria koreensis]|uniref:Uncharacterized protein n=1 Tax=Rothia koreensis TaxID=592378 RepID=A0A7K1LJE9_9MICC|nr:hypothetical protein [Rothia koreensis]MUN55324.1 hypothetical protein [Rothia koreensis]
MANTDSNNTEVEQNETARQAEADQAADTSQEPTEDPSTTEDNADTAMEHPGEDTAGDDGPDDEGQASKLRAEATKYRRQLRETQAQLETITNQRETLLRSSVEAQLPEHLPGKLFWKLSDDPKQFMTEDGDVDSEKVAQTATDIVQEFDLKPRGPVVTAQGQHKQVKMQNSLADAFKPRDL